MKKYYKLIIFAVPPIILFSCINENKVIDFELNFCNHSIKKFNYDAQRTIKINDSLSINNFNSSLLFKQNQTFLYTINKTADTIFEFYFDKKNNEYNLNRQIAISNYKISDFLFVNDTTIFFIGYKHKLTSLFKGVIKNNKLNFVKKLDTSNVMYYSYPFIGNNIFQNGKYIHASCNNLTENINNKIILLDTDSKTKIFSDEKIKSREYSYPLVDIPGKIIKGDTIIFYYGYENYVELYNSKTLKKIGDKIIMSKFAPNKIMGLSNFVKHSFQKIENHIITYPYYLKLIWHPVIKKFIRIFKHEQLLKNNKKLLNLRYNGKWSMIITNEKMEVEYEILMPADNYLFYSIILTEKGVGVQVKNNEKNNQNIHFDIINL